MKKMFKKIGDFFTNLFYPKKKAKKITVKSAVVKDSIKSEPIKKSDVEKALENLKKLKTLKESNNKGKPKEIKEKSKELTGLKSVTKKIIKKKTKEELNEEMLLAVKEEKYELAAKLRDKINEIKA